MKRRRLFAKQRIMRRRWLIKMKCSLEKNKLKKQKNDGAETVSNDNELFEKKHNHMQPPEWQKRR